MALILPLPGNAAENLRESPIVRAVRRVSPAVVNISTAYELRRRANPFSGFGLDPFFEEFFKDFFDPRFEQRRQSTSLGSGVIIDGTRGLILTNAHVIEKASSIKVVLLDEREYEARIIGADPDSDLAVLKIDSSQTLPSVEMGTSDDLMIGETVIAIGNPFGFSHTVTTGVISAVDRSIRTDERVFLDFIQIDASINPGNSGGPLLNINGDLIGINTAIYAKAQGIGFAIPIDKAKKIVADLIQYGEVKQAWVGITVQDLDTGLAEYLKVPGKKGVVIKEVEPESPARRAGLRESDILLSIGGKPIAAAADYRALAREIELDHPLSAEIWRDGKRRSVAIQPKLFPMERAGELAEKLLGIQVADLTEKSRRAFHTSAREGVIITKVNPGTYLARIGVRPGDIIRQMGNDSVGTNEDFKKAIVKHRRSQSVVILLKRGDQGYYITVQL